MIGIYKITSPTSRVYIGQSVNIENRFRDYFQLNSKTKSQVKLYRSFLKHKVETHSFEIIEECGIEYLNIRERYWQDYYNVLEGGLNCVLQKTNELKGVVSKQIKEKARLRMIGHKPSDIHIEKTRLRMIGNLYNLGRIKSNTEKAKIGDTMKKISQGKNNNMFGKFGENNPNSKIILNKQTGIFYFGCIEASTAGNINISSFKKKISGDRINTTNFIYV